MYHTKLKSLESMPEARVQHKADMKRDRANCDIRESINDTRAVRAHLRTKVRENLRSVLIKIMVTEKGAYRHYGFEYNSKALS